MENHQGPSIHDVRKSLGLGIAPAGQEVGLSKFAWTLFLLHGAFVVMYFLLASYDATADAAHVENQGGWSLNRLSSGFGPLSGLIDRPVFRAFKGEFCIIG